MEFSGLKFTEHQFWDTFATFALVFFAVPVPGYIQMNTGISAVQISIGVVTIYLLVHITVVHHRHVKEAK